MRHSVEDNFPDVLVKFRRIDPLCTPSEPDDIRASMQASTLSAPNPLAPKILFSLDTSKSCNTSLDTYSAPFIAPLLEAN